MKGFKIISVTGAHSGVGKTTLCALLLKTLKGFGAIKYTKTHLYTSVTDNKELITQNDKDTALMYSAGAEKVVWIRSPSDTLSGALDIALSKMYGLKGVVIEGNSPVRLLDPDLIIFVMVEDHEVKPSAKDIKKKAHVIVINTGDRGLKVHDKENRQETPIFRINLRKATGEIDKFLEYIKEYIS